MRPATEEGRRGLSGAVLLGGAATRMGRDKASLAVGGVAAAIRVARHLDALCDEVLLVGGRAPAGTPGRAVADPEGPRCALRGLVGALEAARGERVLVVATDLPLVTIELLEGLVAASDADAVVPREELPQPLCAVYRRRPALAAAVANLAAGHLALRALLDVLDVRYVEGEALRALDPDGHALANLNTPEDHALAEAWISARSACPADALPRE